MSCFKFFKVLSFKLRLIWQQNIVPLSIVVTVLRLHKLLNVSIQLRRQHILFGLLKKKNILLPLCWRTSCQRIISTMHAGTKLWANPVGTILVFRQPYRRCLNRWWMRSLCGWSSWQSQGERPTHDPWKATGSCSKLFFFLFLQKS